MSDTKNLPRKASRPPAFTTAQELWDKCLEYFTTWEDKVKPVTVVGLAVFLDVCKDTLNEYGKGTYDHLDVDFSVTVKKAKDYIEAVKWEKALTGQYHHSVAIFDLKVNHSAIETIKYVGKDGESLDTAPKTTIILTRDVIKQAVKELDEEF